MNALCNREGCGNPANPGHGWCSALCRYIDDELDYTRHLISKVGTGQTATDAWTAAVEMADAFTAMRQHQRELKAIVYPPGKRRAQHQDDNSHA